MQQLRHRYHNMLSSPTRKGLEIASRAVTEAALVRTNLNQHYKDRLQRIEKMSARTRKGKAVKASEGTFYTSWLAWKGKSDDYLALETSEEMYARLLKPADKFTIDTTRTPLCAPWREGRRTIVIAATYGALAVIVAAGHAYATRARLEET
ncbi:hypothetical protein HRG_012294 [Hirsutella rhossiliensis]